MKGYKTSEFWVTLLAIVAVVFASIAGLLPPNLAAKCLAISGAAYAISRGLAKITVPNAPVDLPISGTIAQIGKSVTLPTEQINELRRVTQQANAAKDALQSAQQVRDRAKEAAKNLKHLGG